MHRIDGPGATVDNKFTDGDPVGGIQATLVTDDWLNDVQENIMAVLAAASVAPVKGRAADLLDAIRASGAGIVGGARNAKMSVATAAATATFNASELVVETALGGQAFKLANFSKTINLATTGVGGMDTGTAPVSGYVALYAIYNPATGISALLGVNATAAAAPEVYGGANMPAGYTASALVSVWPTNASSQFAVGYQADRDIFFPYVSAAFVTSQVTSMTAVSIAAIVPKNARGVKGWAAITAASAANASVNLAGSATSIGFQQTAAATSGGQTFTGNFSNVPLITVQNIYWSATVASGTFTNAGFYISAYSF